MPSAYQSLLQLLIDGDKVDAATLNQRLKTLIGNDRFFKDLLDEAATGSAIYARDVSIESAAVVGMAVYFNPANDRFERAIARTEVTAGSLATAASSQVWGVVDFKHNSTRADLLVFGYRQLDISAALEAGETLEDGTYYLSGLQAGRLTKTQPPTGIPVLQADGQGFVLVRPVFADSFASHKHYAVNLVCAPAGDENIDGDTVEIDNPDADEEGWLPADHASFNGLAPAGAFFGYNIAASTLANTWPPLPIQSVHLEWFRGDADEHGGTSVPLGEDGLCIIDENGIWWLSECVADAPWTAGTPPGGPCPLPLAMYMKLWYSRMVFQTRSTAVTSLRSGSEQLVIRCLNADAEQATGDLEITLDLDLLLSPTAVDYSGVALKGLTGNVFNRGPVLSSIKSLSPDLTVGSDLAADGSGRYFGNVTLTFTSNVVGGEIPISVVDLYGAQEENYQGTLAIGLPPGRDASFRGEFAIPAGITATSVKTKFRVWILGRTAGDLPNLTFSYRVLPRPNPVGTPTNLVTTDTSGTLVTNNVTVAANQYIEIESNEITAAPGASILFTVGRNAAAGDGYGGEVHFLRQRAAVTALVP